MQIRLMMMFRLTKGIIASSTPSHHTDTPLQTTGIEISIIYVFIKVTYRIIFETIEHYVPPFSVKRLFMARFHELKHHNLVIAIYHSHHGFC